MIKSMRGTPIDLGKIKSENGDAITVGNTSTNVRGDLVGPGGKVIKSKEQLESEYVKVSSTKTISLKEPADEIFLTPEDIAKKLEEIENKQKKKLK